MADKKRFTVTSPGYRSPYSTSKPAPYVFETDDLAEAMAELLGYVREGTPALFRARKAKA